MADILGAGDHWMKDLVTPLQTILIGLPKNLHRRISSFAHRIESDFLSFIVPCWSRHGNDVVAQCAAQTALLQREASNLAGNGIQMVNEHLDDLCKSVIMHDKCYVRQSNKFCGLKMHEFLINLSQRSFRALLELLKESGLIKQLPDSCEHWGKKLANYNNWHNERENAQRRDISTSVVITITVR
ncbi:unnamed protein product [Litomosoides sigmodontis]|uniref:Uncharacterized protein n=1 Tax=Litomosoides sigmodontis TaxID=42156 RepID=A0A3P6THI2_LITSI|nr:unnamed protein product [Litomosoides sigmodontis]